MKRSGPFLIHSHDLMGLQPKHLFFDVAGQQKGPSFWRARHIKKQMFWLEPHEIVRMYEERTATFHSMNEGVIAIDNQHHITIFNEKAKQLLRFFIKNGDVMLIIDRNDALIH